MAKTALITGVTGQDGSYLAEFLLEKDTRFTELNVVLRLSTPRGSTIFMRIRTPEIQN